MVAVLPGNALVCAASFQPPPMSLGEIGVISKQENLLGTK
jgi:hypothetical protein